MERSTITTKLLQMKEHMTSFRRSSRDGSLMELRMNGDLQADRALFYSCAGMPIPAQSSSAGP